MKKISKIFLFLGMFSCACALHATTAAKGVFSVSSTKTVQFANANEEDMWPWSDANAWREDQKNAEGHNGWFVLDHNEWTYLLVTRDGEGMSKNNLGTIAGDSGLIVLPDGWIQPSGVPVFQPVTEGIAYNINTYTAEQWAVMADAGAVFLPGQGYKEGDVVKDANFHGAYWASDQYSETNGYSVHFNKDDIHDQNTFASKSLYYSVILVREVTNTVLDEEDNLATFTTKLAEADDYDYAYVNRTLRKDGTYYTLCLPFDVPDFDDSPLAGAEVFEFAGGAVSGATGAEQLYLHLNRLTGKRLTHGVPYILRWTATDPVQTLATPLYFANVENWDTNTTADSVGNATVKLCGLYPKTHIQDYTAGVAHYHFFMGANNTLYWPDAAYTHEEGHDMKGFRAYFYIVHDEPGSAPFRTMPVVWSISGGFGSATGTEAVTGCGLQVTGTKLFRNGQIVLVMDGKMYDLQGNGVYFCK